MRVGAEHVGKKGKCPKCGTINLIQQSDGLDSLPVAQPIAPLDDLPVAQPIQEQPQYSQASQQVDPFQPSAPFDPFQKTGTGPISSADFNTGASPYRAPSHGGRRQNKSSQGETDVQGILSVVLGGLNLLGIALCICFGPILIAVFLSSIGGMVLGYFAKPPLKMIGMALNGVALTITILLVIAGIALYFFAVTQANPGPPAGFPNF